MSTRIPTRCPGCSATLNIPIQHCGKKVACPKCQTQFRVPMLNDQANSRTPATPAIEASPVPQKQDDPFAEFTDLNSYTPVSSVPAYQTQAATLPAKAKTKAKRKSSSRNERELSESDKSLQGSGFFLLILPVLASVLPLMDLQIARLAFLGEFAPLAAMFLAFIGAGMIAYARRERSDGGMYAGLAALFSLIVGVGGFGLLLYLSEDTSPPTNQQVASAGNSSFGSAPPTDFSSRSSATPTRSGHRLTQPDIQAGDRQSGFSQPGLAQPGLAQPDPARRDQQPPADSTNDKPTETEDPFIEEESSTPGSSDFSKPDFPKPDFAKPAPDPFANLPAQNPNNPIADSKNENGLPDAGSNMEFIKKSGEATMEYMKAFSRASRGKVKYILKNQVGEQSKIGHLFSKDTAEAIGVFNFHGGLLIIPLASNFKSESDKDNVIQPAKGETLAGLRFAFSDGKIVGVQGLIKKADVTALTETKWMGVETDDVQESLNPKPKKARMVVFQSFRDPVGFAWAIEE